MNSAEQRDNRSDHSTPVSSEVGVDGILSGVIMTAGEPEPSASGADRNPVDVLADEFSARLRAGESPTIEEYCERAPEHRAAIRGLFPTIAAIEQMSHQEHTQRRSKRRSLVSRDLIGDFRILREVGRGGMGVVYEAEQQSLHRRVALKVLGSGISESPQQLQRFRLEAESVARLHHTNIVQVYGIGEEDGIHFYAMQFIDGVSLAAAIESQRHRSTDDATIIYDAAPSTSDLSQATVVIPADKQKPPQPSASPVSRPMQASPKPDLAPSVSSVAKLQSATEELFSQINTASFFRRVARLGARVADALHYAHQHGVLHRDIKPSNLMLDRAGDVWIMDFGLVKLAEHQDLTRTGEIVGTLRYMAPEQLNGQAESATDIYSLGLTIFELLTLRPAFDGDSSTTLSQRMRGCEIPRPRSVNSSIPRDLETILLKATSREPSARYATSAAFAEDLQRFCDDRPIMARRSTIPERLWRWSRRNPALAFASSSAVILLGLVAVLATTRSLQFEAALRNAEAAQIQAENNIDLAINAFSSILDNVTSRGVPRSLALDDPDSEADLTQTPLSDADGLLLDRLLEFYRDFAKQSEGNSVRRLRIADAHHRAGSILVRLGRLKEAEEDFERAIELLAHTPKNDSNHTASVVKSAAIYNEIGEVRLRRGEFRQTSNAHLEARALLLSQPRHIQADRDVRFELARATDLLASIDVRSGSNEGPGTPPSGPDGRRPPRRDGDAPPFEPRLEGGRPPRPEDNGPLNGPGPMGRRPPRPEGEGRPGEFGPDGRRPGGRRPPDDPREGPGGPPPRDGETPERLKMAEPEGLKKLGGPPGPPGQVDGLAQTLLEACEEFRSLTREFPDNNEYQFHLAQCLRHRLVHAATNGDVRVARETFQEAVAILDQLATNHPNEPKYLFELSDTLTQASRAQSDAEAKVSLEKAVTSARELSRRFSSVTEYQLLLGTALARKAAVDAAGGTSSDAEQNLKQSIDILEGLAARFPDQGIIQIPLARTGQQLGDWLRMSSAEASSERFAESRKVLEDSIKRFDAYLSKSGKQGNFNTSTQSNLYNSLAETLMRLRLPEQAEQARRKASERKRPSPRPR